MGIKITCPDAPPRGERQPTEEGVKTAIDLWLLTSGPADPFRQPHIPVRVATHLQANPDIDPVMLGADLGLPVRTVRARQRQLGLRKFAYHPSRTAH